MTTLYPLYHAPGYGTAKLDLSLLGVVGTKKPPLREALPLGREVSD